MPSKTAIAVALGMLTDAGMLPGLPADQAGRRAETWRALLHADMSDRVLADAVKRLAAGDFEVYGAVKPQDVNRAATTVRADRVRSWRERHELPTGDRNGFQQSAYLRGFVRAIGNGMEAVEADRHGRAAMVQAEQVAAAEPSTPLPDVLARMDDAVAAGRLPWAASLPAARPVAEIGCDRADAGGSPVDLERARRMAAELAARHRMAGPSRSHAPNRRPAAPGAA